MGQALLSETIDRPSAQIFVVFCDSQIARQSRGVRMINFRTQRGKQASLMDLARSTAAPACQSQSVLGKDAIAKLQSVRDAGQSSDCDSVL